MAKQTKEDFLRNMKRLASDVEYFGSMINNVQCHYGRLSLDRELEVLNKEIVDIERKLEQK